MMLLTAANRKALPPLYSQDGKGDEAIVYVKFFAPWNGWTWYATEFDGEDTFFGYVVGHEAELGYFSLAELASVTGRFRLKIERDMYFTPQTLARVKATVAGGGR